VDSALKLTAVNPSHIIGSATKPSVLVLSTNLASSTWTPLCTNPTSLLPVNYLDTGSAGRDRSFYRLKAWP
jgi:hypothetical protein